mgnify:CR=1 FL=1
MCPFFSHVAWANYSQLKRPESRKERRSSRESLKLGRTCDGNGNLALQNPPRYYSRKKGGRERSRYTSYIEV